MFLIFYLNLFEVEKSMNGQILNVRVFSHMGFKWVLSVALLLKCIYTYTTHMHLSKEMTNSGEMG